MGSIRATIFAMLIAFAPGCVVSGRATVRTTTPDMVMIDDGVYVVEDYSEPVFYSDGVYWRYYGNAWYSSSYHSGGWVVVRSPPRRVITIRNPHTYVHWRATGNVRRQKVRDHREDRREHRQEKRQKKNKRSKVRDHR